jgi:hypothetical protein
LARRLEDHIVGTAPRDGTPILLYTCTDDVAVGEWRVFRDGTAFWEIGHRADVELVEPTDIRSRVNIRIW